MKRYLILPAFIIASLFFSACGGGGSCCVIGNRNANDRISTYGAQEEDNTTKERCQQLCEELSLSADWFDKPCKDVKRGIGQYEKGEPVCP